MDKWRGHRIVLVDGTCLTLPDEPGLHKDFPPPKGNHGYGRYPLARMVCVSLARANLYHDYMANGLEYLTRVHQKLKGGNYHGRV